MYAGIAQSIALSAATIRQTAPVEEVSTLDKLRAKIRRMAALYRTVVWTVVFVTGYLSFFAGHAAFGTLADYFTLFLWALGLTSTGTQIITRIHKP